MPPQTNVHPEELLWLINTERELALDVGLRRRGRPDVSRGWVAALRRRLSMPPRQRRVADATAQLRCVDACANVLP